MRSAKRRDEVIDVTWFLAHFFKSFDERLAMAFGGFKKPVVGDLHARVMPNSLGGVEFGPVGWQMENSHAFPVFREPVAYFRFLVVARIVLNEVNSMAPAVEGGQDDLVQEGAVGFPLKVFLVMQVGKFGRFQTHRSEYFLRIALAARRDLRLAATRRPGGMESRRLAEGRLVGENNHGPFLFCVFFRFG